MLALLTILALQAAPAAKPEPKAERWSILVPVADEPCRPSRNPDAVTTTGDKPDADVVVCGDALPSQRLPLPNEAEPSGPTPSNRDLSGSHALASEGTPCAARQGGCTVGFGPPILPIVAGAVGLVKDAFKKNPDRSNRVAIPLEDPRGENRTPAGGESSAPSASK